MVDIALGGGRKEFLPKPYALKIGHILAYLGHVWGIFWAYFAIFCIFGEREFLPKP